MTRNCLICGKEFIVNMGNLRKGGAKYCSNKCVGISYRGQIRNPKRYKTCKICNKPFKAKAGRANTAKYCCRKCFGVSQRGKKLSKIQIKEMGRVMKKAWAKPNNAWSKLDRTGKNNGMWKGGRTICKKHNAPYVLIKDRNHPFANPGGYVYEHRLVMEKYLGRYLKPIEIVHHINKDTSDNRIENLKLFKNYSSHMIYHKLNRI
jgi:hypothetical protein